MENSSAIVVTSTEIERKLTSPVVVKNGKNMTIAKAVWDTGATCTCISPALAKELKLQPIGTTNVLSASNEVEGANIYNMDIIICDGIRLSNVTVCEMAIQYQKIGLLIGMDIISAGDFAVSNFDGKTTFTYRLPSLSETKFTAHEYTFQDAVAVAKELNEN